ncbi:MAG: DUF624 domain-containing protein, partial [Lachnospiraceae bacterium]|nr:DUF624 domain-containing protein [Lachnospiraceae bacterium]
MSEEKKGRKQWFVPKKDYPRQQGRELEFIRFLKTMFREFWELMKLNFLFIVTCLGVITIPAAITARNAITITMYRDKNHFLWRDYWKAFKADFWRALLGGAVYGALLTLFFISTYFYYQLAGRAGFMFVVPMVLSIFMFLVAYISAVYFFRMLPTVDLKLWPIFKNSVMLFFLNFPRNLLAILIIAIFAFVGFGLLPYSAVVLVAIHFSLLSLALDFITYGSVEKYVILSEEEEEEPSMETYDKLASEEDDAEELKSA